MLELPRDGRKHAAVAFTVVEQAMAPGIDLMTLTNWDAELEKLLMPEEDVEPPPLIGIPDPADVRKPEPAKPDKAPDKPSPPDKTNE